jgi:hypothetical protein
MSQYPLTMDVEYPERLSRLLIFVKWLLAIPHLVILFFYGIVIGVVLCISWFAILFTGKFPRSLFDLVVGYYRWTMRVEAYTSLLRDEYPPFSGEQSQYPLTMDVEYPERLSRLLIFVKWLLAFPHYIVLYFYGIVISVVLCISWFAILFTGKFPRSLFDLVVGYYRWTMRVNAYTSLLRDEYPPFSGE